MLEKIIGWPVSQRFPALDILRLLVTHPEGAKKCVQNNLLDRVISMLSDNSAPFANHLMSLRTIANSFRFTASRNEIHKNLSKVRGAFRGYVEVMNFRLSLLCYNIILVTKKKFELHHPLFC